MNHQIGSKLYVLDRIIQDYIDDDMDCEGLQNLRAALSNEEDIAPAIAECSAANKAIRDVTAELGCEFKQALFRQGALKRPVKCAQCSRGIR